MQSRKLGSLHAHIAGGPDREGGGEGPVIVLLHGFGAPGDDLVSLHRVFRVETEVRWVFPEAPLDLSAVGYGLGARAWWMLDLAALERTMQTGPEDRSGEHPAELPEARGALSELLDVVEKELRPSKLILGGFSQGAMLSLDAALHDPRPLAGLIQLSGTVIAESEWKPRMASRQGLPVFQSQRRAA